MKQQIIKKNLEKLMQTEIPDGSVNLWNEIHDHIENQAITKNTIRHHKKNLAFVGSLVLIISFLAVLFSPHIIVFADEIISYFRKAESDLIEVDEQTKTDVPAQETELPIENSEEYQDQDSFVYLYPAWMPENLLFTNENFDAETLIHFQYYTLIETNGLVIKQETIGQTKACQLCSEVGSSAIIESIDINSFAGQYVQGVWKYDDNGNKFWENDPYLQRIRWQTNDMAFEILYMGDPEELTLTDLILIAESLQ